MSYTLPSKDDSFPFIALPAFLGTDLERAKIQPEKISVLGMKILEKGQNAPFEFLTIHRAIRHLKKTADLPESMQNFLNKTTDLSHQFELFIQKAESKGLEPDTIKEIYGILDQFTKLQKEQQSMVFAKNLSNVQLTIGKEIDELAKKITLTAQWLEFYQKTAVLQKEITHCVDEMQIYQTFACCSGIKNENPLKVLTAYRHLRSALEETLVLYDESYVHAKRTENKELNLAMKESLAGPIHQLTNCFIDFHETFEKLLVDCEKGKNTTEAREFLLDERQAIEHLHRKITYLGKPREALKQKYEVQKRWLSGVFHAFMHPLESTQKAFDYLEQKSPLPTYSKDAILREKEISISQDLRILNDLLATQSLRLQKVQGKMDLNVPDHDKGKEKNYFSDYTAWLDAFIEARKKISLCLKIQETNDFPGNEDVTSVRDSLKMIQEREKELIELQDRLLAEGLNPEILRGLRTELEANGQQVKNLEHILRFRQSINRISERSEKSLLEATDQSLEIAKGSNNYTIDSDAVVLQQFNGLVTLYILNDGSDLPIKYRNEILRKVEEEAYLLEFNRQEYRVDYREALEAEVAKALEQESNALAANLLQEMKVCEQRLSKYKRLLDRSLLPLLADEKGFTDERARIYDTFQKAHRELQKDIAFYDSQISILKQKKGASSTLQTKWKVRQREANISHTIKILEEADKEEGWGTKVLRTCLYGLYYSDKIRSCAQFADQAYHYWNTGENALKPYAELMSKAEFAREAGELPQEEQARISVEMNLIEGIVKGYIRYTAEIASAHPAVANYLKEKNEISSPIQASGLSIGSDTEEEVMSQGGPDARALSSSQLNELMVGFLGREVENYFTESGKTLTWRDPLQRRIGDPFRASDSTALEPAKEMPVNPLEVFSLDLVAAIKDHQSGLPLEENPHLRTLQESVNRYFGAPLPQGWIENWLFKQKWTEERLALFSVWMERSLQTQFSLMMVQQQKSDHVFTNSETASLLPTTLGMPSIGQAYEERILASISLDKQEPSPMASAASQTNSLWVGLMNAAQEFFTQSPIEESTKFEGKAKDPILTSADAMPAISAAPKASKGILGGSVQWVYDLLRGFPLSKEEMDARFFENLKTFLSLPPIPIDDTIFMHVAGDIIGQGTGLEGGTFKEMLTYRLKIMEQQLEAMFKQENVPVERMQELQKISGQLKTALKLFESMGSDGKTFQTAIQEEISNLNEGESFFFPGGWTGHGIVYEVVKQSNGLLTFRIFNTGMGSTVQRSTTIGTKQLYLPFTEIEDISAENFLNPFFIQGIQNLYRHPLANTKSTNLYEYLLTFLKGKMSDRVYSLEDIRELQKSGTCSYMSISAVLTQAFSSQSLSKRFEFETQLKAIADYSNQYQDLREIEAEPPVTSFSFFYNMLKSAPPKKNASSEVSRKLLTKTNQAFLVKANALHEEGLISDQELEYTVSIIARIQKSIAISEESHLANVAKHSEFSLEKSLSDVEFPSHKMKDLKPNISMEGYLTLEMEAKQIYTKVGSSDWTPSPMTLGKDLLHIREQFEEAARSKNFDIAREGVRAFILKIPLSDEDFWKSVDEPKLALTEMANLSRDLLKNYFLQEKYETGRVKGKIEISSEDYLASAKMLLLANKLMKHHAEKLGLNVPIAEFNHNLFNQVRLEKKPFVIRDPAWEGQLELIMREAPHIVGHIKSKIDDFELLPITLMSKYLLLERPFFPFETLHTIHTGEELRTIPFLRYFLAEMVGKQDVIEKFYPELRGKSDIQKAIFLYADETDVLEGLDGELPPRDKPTGFLNESFYDLRDLAVIVDIMNAGLIMRDLKETFNPNAPIIHKAQTIEKDQYAFKLKLFGLDVWVPYGGFLPGLSEEFPESLKTIIFPIEENSDFGDKIGDFYTNGERLHDNVIRHPFAHQFKDLFPGISPEDLGNLLYISSFPDLQVQESLAYFSKNPNKLIDSDYQKFFAALLFEPGKLFNEFRKPSPISLDFIRQMEGFCQSEYLRFRVLGDSSTAIFFLQLQAQFDLYVEQAEKVGLLNFGEQKKEPTFVLKEANDLLAEPGMKIQDKLVLHEIILKTVSMKDVSSMEVSQLLESHFFIQMNNVTRDKKEKDHKKELSVLFRKHRDFIEKTLKDNEQQILNSIYQSVYPSSTEVVWEGSPDFPYYQSEDGKIRINILKGTMQSLDPSVQVLPREIYSNKYYEQIFHGFIPPIVKRLGNEAYQFEGQYGDSLRIMQTVGGNNPIVVQRNIKDTWFQLTDFGPEDFPNCSPIARNHLAWYAKSTDEFCPSSAYFSDPITHAPEYLLEETDLYKRLHTVGVDSRIPWDRSYKVFQVNAKGEKTGLVVANLIYEAEKYEFLKRIEALEEIVLLKDEASGEPRQIIFPNLNFKMDIVSKDGEFQIIPQTHPDFVLSKKQFLPSLGDMTNYLLFEKDLGKGRKQHMVLFPSGRPEESKSSLETPTKPQGSTLSAPYFTYKVDSSGLLKPDSDSARLFLSMMYLWEQDYEQASFYMKGFGSQLKAFTNDELSILKQISTLGKDMDPKAVALRLKAIALIQKNRLDNFQGIESSPKEEAEKTNFKKYKEDYYFYLNNKEHVPESFMPPEEEIPLLRYLTEDLKEGASIIDYRIEELRRKEGAGYLSFLDVNPPKNIPENIIVKNLIFKSASVKGNLHVTRESIAYASFFQDFESERKKADVRSDLFSLRMAPHFLQIYRIGKEQSTDKNAISEALKQVFGIYVNPNDYSTQQMQQLLKDGLILAQRSESSESNVNVTLAAILEAVLSNPSSFPEYTDLNSSFRASAEKRADALYQVLSAAKQIVEDHPAQIQLHQLRIKDGVPQTFREEQIVDEEYQLCLELLSDKAMQEPLISDSQAYAIEVPWSSAKKEEFQENHNEMVSQFTVKMKNSIAQRELDRTVAGLQDYAEEMEHSTTYQITDWKKTEELESTLTQSISRLSSSLEQRIEGINRLLNKPFADPVAEASRQARILAGTQTPITLEEGLVLFLQRDADGFKRENPALDMQDILQIHENLFQYLLEATHLQHFTRVQNLIQQIEEGNSSNIPEEDKQELLRQYATALSMKREYDPAVHPEYLVFEYFMEMLLYDHQVGSLDKLQISEGVIHKPENFGVVLEMIMGSGKTAVLFPLLLFLNANGSNLSMGVMPDALVPSMAEELQKTLGSAFRKTLEVMQFDREMKMDIDDVRVLTERLERAVKKRRAVLFSHSSMMSLYLKFSEALADYSKSQDKAEKASLNELITNYRQIFGLMRTKGRLVMDEAHQLEDVLKSFHYAYGDPVRVHEATASSIGSLFLYMSQSTEIRETIKLHFVRNSSITIPFTEENYHQLVKPILIEAILSGKVAKADKRLQEFLLSLDESQKLLVRKFLQNESSKDADAMIASIQKPYVQDMLAMYKEELNVLLPLTASKNVNEHYGSSRGAEAAAKAGLLAIPYRSSKPSEKSDFGTDPEILNYTLQMYLELGLPDEIVVSELERIQASLIKSTKESPGVFFKDFPVYREFEELIGDLDIPLFNPSKEQISLLTKRINQNPDLLIKLYEMHIVPELKVFPKQLNADSQVFGILVKAVMAFTGTAWNVDAFPTIFKVFHPSNTQAKTLHLLWKNSPQKLQIIETPLATGKEELHKVLLNYYGDSDHDKGSFIDRGSLLKSYQNQEVAEAILQMPCWENTKIKGVVFYDKKDRLMVAKRVGGQIIIELLSKSDLQKEEIIVYWDQAHSFGSDVRLGASMTAVITFSRHTLISELLQAAWRLRGLDKNQKVSFSITTEDEQIIRFKIEEMTGKKIDGELEMRHLLLYAVIYQAEKLGQDNYRSFKQKLNALLLDKVWEIIVDPEISIEEFGEIYSGIEGLFQTTVEQRPYLLYKDSLSEQERELAVKQDVEQFFASASFLAFTKNPLLQRKFDPELIKQEVYRLVSEELDGLPDFLKRSTGYEKERNVQLESSHEKEKGSEKEAQREMNSERAFFESGQRPKRFVSWDRENVFSKKAFEAARAEVVKDKSLDPKDLQSFPHAYEINDVFSVYESFHQFAGLFNPDLICSTNVCQLARTSVKVSEFSYEPFNFYQKTVTQVLVVEDKATGHCKTILLDANDAFFFQTMLEEDLQNPEKHQNKEVRLGLYHLTNGLIMTGSEPLEKDRLDSNAQFNRLKVQAKFLAGDIDYSTKELEEMEIWLKEAGPRQLFTLFNDQILAWKDVTRAAFPQTGLYNIFRKLNAA